MRAPMMYAHCNNCRTLYMPAHGPHTICHCNGETQLVNVVFRCMQEGPGGADEDKSTKESYDNAIRTMCDIADRRAEALQEVFQRMMRRAIGAPEKQPKEKTE